MPPGNAPLEARTNEGPNMSERISIVTGASSGIGRELTRRLAASGHRVYAADIHESGLRDTVARSVGAEERVSARQLDVRDAGAWHELIEEIDDRHGQLDYLFNVAGVIRPGRVWDVSEGDVDLMFDVNTKGTIHGTRSAAAYMVKQGKGHIVNVASLAGLSPVPGLTLYSASKFAVRGFSLAAAMELKSRGVALSCVCPDAVATPMLDLQVDYPEASITFSGAKALTTAQVVDLIVGPVMRDRPLEVTLPSARGAAARFAGTFPGVVAKLQPVFEARGRANQQKYRGGEGR